MKNVKNILAGFMLLCVCCLCIVGFTGCSGETEKFHLTLCAELEDGTSLQSNNQIILYGDGEYLKDKVVKYGAVSLDDRYEFVKWEEDNGTDRQDYLALKQNTTRTAIFKRKYKLNRVEFYVTHTLSDVNTITINLSDFCIKIGEYSIRAIIPADENMLKDNFDIEYVNSVNSARCIYFYNDYFMESGTYRIHYNILAIKTDGYHGYVYDGNETSAVTVNPHQATMEASTGFYKTQWYSFTEDGFDTESQRGIYDKLTLNVRFVFE